MADDNAFKGGITQESGPMTLSEKRIAEIRASALATAEREEAMPESMRIAALATHSREIVEACRLALIGKATEGAQTGRVDMVCASDGVVIDELENPIALNKKRVRIVPCTEEPQ